VIRLLLTDVDGTLIGSGSVIHPRVLAALETARGAGLHLAICTGRPLFSRAKEYAELVSPAEPHIFQNGAHVAKLDGNSIHQSILARGAYQELVALSRRTGIALEVYTAARCFVELHTEIAVQHQHLIGISAEHRDLLSITEPVLRAQWVNTASDEGMLFSQMQTIANIQFSSAGTPDMPDVLFTSVTRAGTSKLEGATALAAYYGVTIAETMMVGDGDNDVELLAAVGLGVAMGNASPAALNAAKTRVGHVNDGGLADAVGLALETLKPEVKA
jgi:Cof subfamily protein (haloacid dehalogenase superfamily)